MRVGVLTGGGDCPGLNAVIRAVVRKGEVHHDDEFIGFREGWLGVIEGRTTPLDIERCRGILPRGGTILGTSRTNPYKVDGGVVKALDTLRSERIDALVAIGGEDTLGVASKLSGEGVSVIGVPKTIDNDLSATEVTFGFHTAVQIATEAIDRLHTTAESHDRVIVCEVMGRHAGWIATYAGIAGGAAEILVPEEPFDIDDVCRNLKNRHSKGRFASIVVVAEGATPAAGTMTPCVPRRRPVRPSPPRRHRQRPRRGDRAEDGLRDPGHHSRSHTAGRHAHRVRPGAGHPLRHCRHRRRPPAGIRSDGRASGRPDRSGPADRSSTGPENGRSSPSSRGSRGFLGLIADDGPRPFARRPPAHRHTAHRPETTRASSTRTPARSHSGRTGRRPVPTARAGLRTDRVGKPR